MRARVLGLGSLLCAVIGCAKPQTGPPPAVAPPSTAPDPLAELDPETRQIAREVEEARGLRFRRPFTVHPVDDDGLEARFDEGRLNPAPDAANLTALWAFGLFKQRPPPTWLTSLLARRGRRTEGLLGFFVSASRRVYIRVEVSRDVDTVAHELAHALVDDHFALPLDRAPTDDAQLALRSLSEGDATITAAIVAGQRKGRSAAAVLNDASSWDPSTRDHGGDANAALRATLPLFRERAESPYRAGALFVARVVEARGMRGLDAVWHQPPRGTFEVFHPESYAKGWALPRIAPPPLPAGCRSQFEGTMGELRTRAFLGIVHPRVTALAGASGLVADRYQLLDGCATDPSFVWQTAWADEDAATRFENLAKRLVGCKGAGCLPGPGHVARRGKSVVIARGTDDERITEAAHGAIQPPGGADAPRLGGAKLEPTPEEKRFVEGSAGRTCEIAGTGVSLVVPKGLAIVADHKGQCELGADTADVAVETKVLGVAYNAALVDSVRKELPRTLAAMHATVTPREHYRVTPVGTGLGLIHDLTDPLRLEVVLLPVCNGKRVLTLYLRTTTEEGRATMEEVLLSLRPTTVGLAAACGDPVDL